MTVTEAPRAADDEVVAAPSPPPAPTGLAAWVGSGDPRTIGRLFIGTSLVFLLVSGVAGALVGFEQFPSDSKTIMGADTVVRVTTLHASAGLFLGVLPLLIGLATAVVPLQVGASTIAFPRASAAAYWTWLVSGAIVLLSYAVDGGPYGTDRTAVGMYVLALIAVLVALVVATVSVATTALALRAPGMGLRRAPLFTWSMLVGGTVWILTLPVLAAMLLLTYIDLNYGQQFLGGSGGIWNHVAWAFWQPTVYVFAVPALGIIADVVPVFARRRHQRHSGAMVLLGLAAALGFGAWVQLGATVDGKTPAPWLHGGVWITVGYVSVIPVLGLLGLWTATLFKGRPRLGTPLVLSLFAGLLVLAGVAGGIATVVGALDLVNTTWMTAQAEVVLIGALLAGLAGVTFWAPKVYGKLVPDWLMRLGGTLIFIGAAATAVGFGVAGFLDQARFTNGGISAVASGDVSAVEGLDLVAALGLTVVVAGALLAAVALLARGTRDPGDDPWDGHTLEWTTSSPPPVGNFASVPAITSEAPLYDSRYAPREATETEGSA